MVSDLTKAYDDWHALIGADVDTSSPWHEIAKDWLEDIRGLEVLEIGCGRGGFTQWLASRQPRLVVGADFSPVAVEFARGLVESELVTFQVADICDIPAADGAFDLVISCETIEHVLDPRGGVAELFRVLRPGGTLILTTPNYLNLFGLYRGYLRLTGRRYTEAGQPVNNFTSIPRVNLWLRNAGFRVTANQSIGHYVPWPGRRPIRVLPLDRRTAPLRWLGHHSLFVAKKDA